MIDWVEIDIAISGIEQPMNVYSPKGSKVMVTEQTVCNGYTHDSEKVKKLLEIGKVYTVDHTEVFRYTTDVYLEEFPGVAFNSVNFVNVNESEVVK